MSKKFSRYFLCALAALFIVFLVGCDPRYGFVESNFELASDSKIPTWVDIAKQPNIKIEKISFTFYSHPFLNKVKILVNYKQGDASLTEEYVGDMRYHENTKDKPRDYYPRYLIITVDNVDEVFVRKKRGPLLYVAEDM